VRASRWGRGDGPGAPPRVPRRRLLAGLAATASLSLGCQSPTLPSLPGLPVLGPTATPVRPRTSPPGTVTLGLAVEPSTLAAPPGQEGWGGRAYANRLVANLTMCQLIGVDDRGDRKSVV